MSNIKVTLAQLNPTVGDLEGNSKTILNIWKENDRKSDIVLFPELFLTGYPPEDLTNNNCFLSDIENKISEILAATKHLTSYALLPTIWRENDRIYNAALIIQSGEIKYVVKKQRLPNYSVFDEHRNFDTENETHIYNINGLNLGFMICEDLWYSDSAQNLADNGANILISINGSPYNINQAQYRNHIATTRLKETSLPLIYLNMVGGQDELVFDGGSFALNAQGEYQFNGDHFDEQISVLEINKSSIHLLETRKSGNIVFDNAPYNALILGLRDYVHKNKFKKVLLGLSGGIDSALTAAIAVDALGRENVRCVMLPSEFTSEESLEDAKQCAEMLGVKYQIIPIKDAVKIFENLIPNLSGLGHENTQSRIRGTILMALSNMSGEMLLTTGNKSEMAVGYCTLYGDMNGGYNPLKDVYKTMVYDLSKWRNTVSPVMPDRIITKEPTAELRSNQKDQDSLPPYDVLDDILFMLVEADNINWSQNITEEAEEIRKRCATYPAETIEKVATLLKITEYKRYQAPPGTRITNKAFGRDRRYPLTNAYINKIEKA